MNKVIIIGRLGQKVETSTLPSGNAVANASLAVSKSWTDRDGNKKEVTDWIPLVAFGKIAEILANHWKVGDKYLVEGELRIEKWQAEDGSNRSAAKVYIKEFEFLTPKTHLSVPSEYDPDAL